MSHATRGKINHIVLAKIYVHVKKFTLYVLPPKYIITYEFPFRETA